MHYVSTVGTILDATHCVSTVDTILDTMHSIELNFAVNTQ
jgi:hypothetical protein